MKIKYNIELVGRSLEPEIVNTLPGGLMGEFIEEVLREILKQRPPMSICHLKAKLPRDIHAKVLRNPKFKQDIVRLESGGKSIDLTRDSQGVPGDIGVSCNPRGDEVPVSTLNIAFRDYDDDLTDRGMVYVFPGDPAIMFLSLKPKALEISGSVTEIIKVAEEAVENQLLIYFETLNGCFNP